MKKILLSILILSFLIVKPAFAEEGKVTLYLFHSIGCPHCEEELKFLPKLQEKYSWLEVKTFEVSQDKDNADLYEAVGKKLGADTGYVPMTVVGEKYVNGYSTEEVTGKEIEALVLEASKGGTVDIVKPLIKGNVLGEEASKSASGYAKYIIVAILLIPVVYLIYKKITS